MKKLFLIGFLACFLNACNDSQGGGLVFNPDDGIIPGDDGTVNTGLDPGKAANDCYPAFADDELNVVTWNIEFLSEENTNFDKVSEIVEDLDADVIAIQEINSISGFVNLANQLPEWTGYYRDIGGSLDLGFLVKTDAFLSIGEVFEAVDTSPRETIGIELTHISGLEVTLLNIHLKCCGEPGDFEQREQASIAIKNYIDQNLADEAVILLGDFNDEIASSSSPFQNFKEDASNYQFADIGIANGSSFNFSYPSWPSHLDHLLITDELFDLVGLVQTITAEDCVSSYSSQVSDHRPVLASFK